MSITYWQDEQTLRASDSALTSVRREATSRFGAGTPASENYEAAAQHRPQPTELGNWVRVTSLQGDPAKADEAIRHFESEVIPAVSRLSGFRAAVLLVDRATGKALVGTVWNTKQDGRSQLERSHTDPDDGCRGDGCDQSPGGHLRGRVRRASRAGRPLARSGSPGLTLGSLGASPSA